MITVVFTIRGERVVSQRHTIPALWLNHSVLPEPQVVAMTLTSLSRMVGRECKLCR